MSDVQIYTCTEEDSQRWDEYVNAHSGCTSYHRWAWKRVFKRVFGWPATYLLAEHNGTVCGILPLIRQKCCLRSYLSSMPHLKGGGIVADDDNVEQLLFQAAIEAANLVGATYLELRHISPRVLPTVMRNDKVSAILPIEADIEKRWERLHKKTRNLVRKSLTYGMTAEVGGPDLLTPFYRIYRQNMHDLGSPAYSRSFFSEIFDQLPDQSRICLIRSGSHEVAAGFIIGFRDTIEVGWASSYKTFLHLKPNMFLYWNILSFAAEQGYKYLDFVRSSRHSGTLDFKMQWGATANDLHWSYYWPKQQPDAPKTRAGGMQMASRIWKRLPLVITNAVGPTLVRNIPGI
jgi:serine/alanine adding enzyme